MHFNRPFYRFISRWFVCSIGLWIAAGFLSKSISLRGDLLVVILAGLILALINTVIKPLIVLLSLPVILFTLGLFMVVINGLMVYLASRLYHPLHVTNFWAALFAGIVIGLVNYLVTSIIEDSRA